MATAEQIGSALQTGGRVVGQSLDHRAEHYLVGATVPDEWSVIEAAARVAARLDALAVHRLRAQQREDTTARPLLTPNAGVEALGLPVPPRPADPEQASGCSVLEGLYTALQHGGETDDDREAAARRYLAGLPRDSVKAAKRELQRRRTQPAGTPDGEDDGEDDGEGEGGEEPPPPTARTVQAGDTLRRRVQALEAERARVTRRPARKGPTTEELLRGLIGALHRLYCTPPDRPEETPAAPTVTRGSQPPPPPDEPCGTGQETAPPTCPPEEETH